MTATETVHHSISIAEKEIHKIPEKYLPENSYVIKLGDGEFDPTSTEQQQQYMCAENYDNFADILYNGGTVWLDAPATDGVTMRMQPNAWNYVPGTGFILMVFQLASLGTDGGMVGVQYMFVFTNGTWAPPAT